MPLLQIQTNLSSITDIQKNELMSRGSQILADEIGKSLEFVMVVVEKVASLYFQGDSQSPCLYASIKNIGILSPALTTQLSQKLCKLFEEILSVAPTRCYLEFQEIERHHWGWNAKTFA